MCLQRGAAAALLSVPTSMSCAFRSGHRALARIRPGRTDAGVATTGRRRRKAGEQGSTLRPLPDRSRTAGGPYRRTADPRPGTSMPDHPTPLLVANRHRPTRLPASSWIPGEQRRSIHMKTPLAAVTSRAQRVSVRSVLCATTAASVHLCLNQMVERNITQKIKQKSLRNCQNEAAEVIRSLPDCRDRRRYGGPGVLPDGSRASCWGG